MGDTEYRDALIYATLENQLNAGNFRVKPGNATFYNYNSTQGKYVPTSKSEAYNKFLDTVGTTTQNGLNTLMANTTIKRACCVGNEDDTGKYFKTKVKLPYIEDIASEMNPKPDPSVLDNWKKLGYMHKDVLVPKSLCPVTPVKYLKPISGDKTINPCDKFYQTYCENAKLLYSMDLSGRQFDNEEFRISTPDCACYIDRPEDMDPGVQPPCYTTGCYSTTTAYSDPATRGDGACKINKCASYFDITEMTALTGGKIDAEFNLTQNCGAAKEVLDQIRAGEISGEDAADKLAGKKPGVATTPAPVPAPSFFEENKTLIIGGIIACVIIIIIIIIVAVVVMNKSGKSKKSKK
jgi:hypothetical protein